MRYVTAALCLAFLIQSPDDALAQPTNRNSTPAAAGTEVDLAHPFAIQLGAYPTAIDPRSVPGLARLGAYRVYVMPRERAGRTNFGLRLGFFPTREAAEAVAAQLRAQYPGAWVERASDAERLHAARTGVGARVADRPARPPSAPAAPADPTPRPPTPASPAKSAITPAAPPATPKSAAPMPPAAPSNDRQADAQSPRSPAGNTSGGNTVELMREARTAMTANDFPRAILLYTQVVQVGGAEDRQQAQEFLGLARERNGQKAQAIAEYEEYLRRYPQGESSDRVRQRLAGIATATATPQKPLAGRTSAPLATTWNYGGSISQYYSRHESFDETSGGRLDQSSLDHFVDLNAGVSGNRLTSNARVSGSYTNDFLSGASDISRLSAAYADLASSDLDMFTRVGRQTRTSGGVQVGDRRRLVPDQYQVSDRWRRDGVEGLRNHPLGWRRGPAGNRP